MNKQRMNEQPCCEISCMEVTPLSEEALFQQWLDRMPEYRRRKVLSMQFAEGQRLSLGVGVLLFQALERRGIDGKYVEILETEFGQPYFPQYPEIHFSLSHAGSWAMCAVSRQPVGCDVERTGRGDERLAKYCFAPEELEALGREKSRAAWDQQFTEIWTRKESYLKATGRGLSLQMKSFSSLASEEKVWYDEYPAAEGYVFSCCVLGDKPEHISRDIVRL